MWQCVALLGMRFPSVDAVYTAAALDRLADVWAPIFERHNWTFAKWAIYLAAASATAPVIGETIKAVRADRALELAAAAVPAAGVPAAAAAPAGPAHRASTPWPPPA